MQNEQAITARAEDIGMADRSVGSQRSDDPAMSLPGGDVVNGIESMMVQDEKRSANMDAEIPQV